MRDAGLSPSPTLFQPPLPLSPPLLPSPCVSLPGGQGPVAPRAELVERVLGLEFRV